MLTEIRRPTRDSLGVLACRVRRSRHPWWVHRDCAAPGSTEHRSGFRASSAIFRIQRTTRLAVGTSLSVIVGVAYGDRLDASQPRPSLDRSVRARNPSVNNSWPNFGIIQNQEASLQLSSLATLGGHPAVAVTSLPINASHE